MKNYVRCQKVNICKDFPEGCSPLCDDFQGYSCMGDEDIMNPLVNREISDVQLSKNDRKYCEVSGTF